MKTTTVCLTVLLTLLLMAPVVMVGRQQQGSLDPSTILKPLSDSWPTYSGDYSGKRYSTLTHINQDTVKHLTLAWVARLAGGAAGAGFGGGTPTIVGGEGSADLAGGGVIVKGSILQVDGVLYVSAPDNAWAVDAR